jgi:hypothetical protein
MAINLIKPWDWRVQPVWKSPLPVEYVHGAATLIASGPPFLPDEDIDIDVYPIGFAQSFNIVPQFRLAVPFKELGSQWVHVMPADTPLYLGSIDRIVTVRANLAKALLSYYLIYDPVKQDFTNELDPDAYPDEYMPDVETLPPNTAGLFVGGYSSFFRYPFGAYVSLHTLIDAPGSNQIGGNLSVGQYYLERCYLMEPPVPLSVMPDEPMTADRATFIIGFLKLIPNPDFPIVDDRDLIQKIINKYGGS